MRTRHGRFTVLRPRLRDRAGREVCLPCRRVSGPLRQRCLFWANRLPFGDVTRLLEEGAGRPLLSEDSLWRLVQEEAAALDEAQQRAIAQAEQDAQLAEPTCAAPVDLYGGEVSEFLVMTDAIGVKAQKPTRERAGQNRQAKKEKRHDTDVFVLARRDGSEQILCEGLSGAWSVVGAVRAFLKREWSGQRLSVVALTDGASTIRADLWALFGEGVAIILDWYHLHKRVYQQLSKAAHSMQEREAWEQAVMALLWRGKADEAISFLSTLRARNPKAVSELVGYLQKHSAEIIDYERRQRAGKPIGSGRMEKCVDQVIGLRQKDKGMSWTRAGTRALALLKGAELNARSNGMRAVLTA